MMKFKYVYGSSVRSGIFINILASIQTNFSDQPSKNAISSQATSTLGVKPDSDKLERTSK